MDEFARHAPQRVNSVGKLLGLLKRRNVAFAMLGVMFTFAGAFATFTYLRPLLEAYTRVSVSQLSLLLLGLGLRGFWVPTGPVHCLGDISTRCSGDFRWLWRHVTLGLLATVHSLGVATMMVAWATPSSAIPWHGPPGSRRNHRRAGKRRWAHGGPRSVLHHAGAAFGGLLLDHISIAATLIGGTILLALASLIVGNGDRIGRAHRAEKGFNADMLGTPEQLYKKPQYTT